MTTRYDSDGSLWIEFFADDANTPDDPAARRAEVAKKTGAPKASRR
jgi:hypothetical protein